jgi:hypothetical protein
MAEENLKKLIASVEPTAYPIYVLLPKAEYDRYRSEWKLP